MNKMTNEEKIRIVNSNLYNYGFDDGYLGEDRANGNLYYLEGYENGMEAALEDIENGTRQTRVKEIRERNI